MSLRAESRDCEMLRDDETPASESTYMIYRAARSAISRDVKAAYILRRDTRARALRCCAEWRRNAPLGGHLS